MQRVFTVLINCSSLVYENDENDHTVLRYTAATIFHLIQQLVGGARSWVN